MSDLKFRHWLEQLGDAEKDLPGSTIDIENLELPPIEDFSDMDAQDVLDDAVVPFLDLEIVTASDLAHFLNAQSDMSLAARQSFELSRDTLLIMYVNFLEMRKQREKSN